MAGDLVEGRWRLGLGRFPSLTVAVLAVTGTVNAAQVASGGVLVDLERTSAGLHGDWWRTGTSLLVQDGGVLGTFVNLGFLLVLGAAAEQVSSCARWLGCYLGAALVGELVGYAWQPTGGGNSVAVCGLAGLVAVALWADDPRLPRYAGAALVYWCGALLAGLYPPLLLVGIGLALVLQAGQRQRCLRRWPVLVAPVFTLVAGVTLALGRDIHGTALLAGLGLAVLTRDAGAAARPPGADQPAPL